MAKRKPSMTPATTSVAYAHMRPTWDKIQAVLDGTDALRKAATKYLPRHSAETQAAYAERLVKNTLYNLSKITLDSWVGRPFSDPIQLNKVPAEIEEMLDNVDLLGNDLHVFARNWFKDGLAKAFSHCYIDFPRIETEEGKVRTKADDAEEGVRPYWVFIQPEQLFFADAQIIDGREVLREIRLKEVITQRDGFAEVLVSQIRRIFLGLKEDTETLQGQVELFRLKDPKTEGTDKEEWLLKESYTFDLDVIPLVTFYSDRRDFMLGIPPVNDLVDLNIAHWQSTSDQRTVLTVARFPILALSGGVDENKQLTIGPKVWLYSPDPKSKFYYVEHSGKAIEAGRQDLIDLEHQMAEYGAEFLKKRPGRETATARALDSAEATSALQDVTRRFADAVTQALDLMAKWQKLEDGGDAELTTDFGPEEVSQAELSTLKETRVMRDISRLAYLTELKRRGLLADEYDIEADETQLENEQMTMFGGPLEPPEEPLEKKEEEEEE